MHATTRKNFSFCKTLVRSNTCRPFQLILPNTFCEEHLLCQNNVVILRDESEREYNVNFLVNKHQLGYGWKDFVIENGLQEGDVLSFHLIGRCKFKVCIKSKQRSTRTNDTKNGLRNQVSRSGIEYNVVKSAVKPSLPANRKGCGPETHVLSPNKKMQPSMDELVKLQCGNILGELKKRSYGRIFSQPVDPVKLNIPDYFSVINEPMDLGTIEHKLDENRYSSMEEFAADVRLTFSNAMWYNPPEHEVHKWAKLCSNHFNKKWRSLEVKLQRRPTAANDDGEDSFDARSGHVRFKTPYILKETNGANGNFNDCSKDTEHTGLVRRVLPVLNVNNSTLLVSDCNSTPLVSVNNSEPNLNFKNIDDVHICVNGEILDFELPVDVRMKYYRLCCSRKKFIHDRVINGLNSTLVVAMILEIVRIADATKAASISTSLQDPESMEKALKSFEDLGMAVGFLRAKIGRLAKFSSRLLMVEESTRAKLAEVERERKTLEVLIERAVAQRELIEQLEVKIDDLKEKREQLELMFAEVVGLKW